MRSVKVYYNDILAGRLFEVIDDLKKYYNFEYDAEYYNSNNPPVSVTLSKDLKMYRADSLFSCFANMYCFSNKKLIEINDFDTLYNIALEGNADFIGAVNVRI